MFDVTVMIGGKPFRYSSVSYVPDFVDPTVAVTDSHGVARSTFECWALAAGRSALGDDVNMCLCSGASDVGDVMTYANKRRKGALQSDLTTVAKTWKR